MQLNKNVVNNKNNNQKITEKLMICLNLNNSSNAKSDWLFFAILLAVSFSSRLLPHVWNFTSLGALFLFAGVYVRPKAFNLALPLVLLMVTDLMIGLHTTLFYVYGAFIAMGFMGSWFAKFLNTQSYLKSGAALTGIALLNSLFFFIVTNFGVWHLEAFYSKDLNGLIMCYLAGLPFLDRQILADVLFINVFNIAFLSYKQLILSKDKQKESVAVKA